MPQVQEKWQREGWQVAKEEGLRICFREFHHLEEIGESLGESYRLNVLPPNDRRSACRTKPEEFRGSGDELGFLPFPSRERKVKKLQELF